MEGEWNKNIYTTFSRYFVEFVSTFYWVYAAHGKKKRTPKKQINVSSNTTKREREKKQAHNV